jgi:glyceraldehyde 3-phosphate dehydrogenase
MEIHLMSTDKANEYLQNYNERLEAAEAMLPLIGQLWRNNGVPTYLYGVPLHLKSPTDILKAHRSARHLARQELNAVETYRALQVISEMNLSPARVDVGKLLVRFQDSETATDLGAFIKNELSSLPTGQQPMRDEPQDVVLYGFGRIGRLLARLLIERMGGGERFRLRAIVTRPGGPDDLTKRADLLRRDSVHGPFKGTITLDHDARGMVINGNLVSLIYSQSPEETDYAAYGIKNALVIDNTGIWRDREGLGRHLKADGVSKVVLTAPAKGDIPNIVFGINHEETSLDERILSAASCTTNAIVPILKAVNDEFGIISGHMQSVHAYTNDQNLIDNYHKKQRRGRGAAMNMVITETGAGKAVAKVCPELKGKLTANAIRVPTPNVSMAIMNLNLERETSKDELNRYLRALSLEGSLQYQVDYTTSPDIVSTDLVGNRHASIVDSHATLVHEHGDKCTLYVWYDNEFGYACQVTRLLEHVAQVRPPVYPR